MKSYLRKILPIITAIVVTACLMATAPPPETDDAAAAAAAEEAARYAQPPDVQAPAAVLIDGQTGTVLFDKDKDSRRFPASTTKIMTGLLAIENLDPAQVLIVDEEASREDGAKLFLLPGEDITVEELMYGMLLPSANDAAVVLAKGVDGSVAAFAERMNARAAELGAVNTHFVNPNGMPNDDHYTTAYDLALIAREAMKYDLFRTYVGTYEHTMPANSVQPQTRTFQNGNRMLYNTGRRVTIYGETRLLKYDEATGVKIGFTNEAQGCIVASAMRDGRELIAVVMQTTYSQMYVDAISMFEYGFHNFDNVKIFSKGENVAGIEVSGGQAKSVNAVCADDVYATVAKGVTAEDAQIKFSVPEKLKAPVEKGAKVGTVEALIGGVQVAATELVSNSTVKKATIVNVFAKSGKVVSVIIKVVIVVAALLIIWLLYIILSAEIRKRKRRRRRFSDKGKYRTREVKRVRRIR